jgi:hypothetical protein
VPAGVDPERPRVLNLAVAMMQSIEGNYRAGPAAPARVCEALNALGMVAAIVICGPHTAEARAQCRRFFDRALEESINGNSHRTDLGHDGDAQTGAAV